MAKPIEPLSQCGVVLVEAVINTVFHIANNRLMFPDPEAFHDVAKALRCIRTELARPQIIQSTIGGLHLPHLHLGDCDFANQMRQLKTWNEELLPQSLDISDRERALVQETYLHGAAPILRRIDNLRELTIFDEQKIENTADILKADIMALAARLAGLKSGRQPGTIPIRRGKHGDLIE